MKLTTLLAPFLAIHASIGVNNNAACAAAAATPQDLVSPAESLSPQPPRNAAAAAPNPWWQPHTLIPTGIAVAVTAALGGVLFRLHQLGKEWAALRQTLPTQPQLDARRRELDAALARAAESVERLRGATQPQQQLLNTVRLHLGRLRREMDYYRDRSHMRTQSLYTQIWQLRQVVVAMTHEMGVLWRLAEEQQREEARHARRVVAAAARRWTPPAGYWTDQALPQCVDRELAASMSLEHSSENGAILGATLTWVLDECWEQLYGRGQTTRPSVKRSALLDGLESDGEYIVPREPPAPADSADATAESLTLGPDRGGVEGVARRRGWTLLEELGQDRRLFSASSSLSRVRREQRAAAAASSAGAGNVPRRPTMQQLLRIFGGQARASWERSMGGGADPVSAGRKKPVITVPRLGRG